MTYPEIVKAATDYYPNFTPSSTEYVATLYLISTSPHRQHLTQVAGQPDEPELRGAIFNQIYADIIQAYPNLEPTCRRPPFNY